MPAFLRSTPKHFLLLAFLTAFSFLLYTEIFTYNTFGPEFPLFYYYAGGLTLQQSLNAYTYTSLMWYRPTAHALCYWIGDQFLHWHNLAGWKLYHFGSVLALGYALYWFVGVRLRRGGLAGLLTATYFLTQPTIYTFVMEASGFDFVYILFVILCVGCYFRALGSSGTSSILPTALSWFFFLAALTSKEMALAVPFYLMASSVLFALFAEQEEPLPKRLVREAARLIPFFAVLPVYYFLHLAKVPPSAFGAAGAYRGIANWDAILGNLRKFPLWIFRIYGYAGETPGEGMHLSTPLNNAVGLIGLVMTAVAWVRMLRHDPSWRLTGSLLVAWAVIFLMIPVYAGGYLWHVNLPLAGYSALFGIAAAWWFGRISSSTWRAGAVALFFVGALWLSRENLRIELYQGTHAAGFRINRSLLERPPVPAERLGSSPLIYIEDRLNLGPWWYGCFGKLFNFVYLRRDLEEVIVPPLSSVSWDLQTKWLARKNAFFFRYDDRFVWRDGSAEFLAAIDRPLIQPSFACAGVGGKIQFTAAGGAGEGRRWSIDPPGAGTIHSDGLYMAPANIANHQTVTVTLSTDSGWGSSATVGLPARGPIRINAGGTQLTDSSGRRWSDDANYDAGEPYTTKQAIAGTDSPRLYQSARFHAGPFGYRFCVPNGAYRVTLKFAEIQHRAATQRVFNTSFNGTPILVNFDVVKEAGGPNRALDREFTVPVTDGEINLQFTPVVSSPTIAAIEIDPIAP